ncbi:M15 family metallopeptidase [Brevundimonas diminuta]|jgi:peptidoglycan L-alanyl-D-glutamate endopeptidase CwlK|uniref:M15 family metallopeptidase n=1 Tax=Brevundimonas diminuta TaxID=293 RepID=UPI003D9A5E69
MAFRLGAQSRARLAGVHPDLIGVVERAIQLSTVDFSVLEGVRTQQRQRELYAQGRTKPGKVVTWTLTSNHFVNPKTGYGHAVDLIPFPVDWEGPTRFPKFDAIAKAMFAASKERGVRIRWGADWDMDGKPRERGETDSPHFELVR